MLTTPNHLFALHIFRNCFRISWSITFPVVELRLMSLQFPGSDFLLFWKTGGTFSFSWSSGTSPVLPDLSKTKAASWWCWPAPSALTCILSDPVVSCVSSSVQCSLTWSSSTEGRHWVPQYSASPLPAGTLPHFSSGSTFYIFLLLQFSLYFEYSIFIVRFPGQG